MRRILYYEEKLTPQNLPLPFSSIFSICSFLFPQTFPSKLANKVLGFWREREGKAWKKRNEQAEEIEENERGELWGVNFFS